MGKSPAEIDTDYLLWDGYSYYHKKANTRCISSDTKYFGDRFDVVDFVPDVGLLLRIKDVDKTLHAERTNKKTGELYRCRGEMEDMGIVISKEMTPIFQYVFQCVRCGSQHVYRCFSTYNPSLSRSMPRRCCSSMCMVGYSPKSSKFHLYIREKKLLNRKNRVPQIIPAWRVFDFMRLKEAEKEKVRTGERILTNEEDLRNYPPSDPCKSARHHGCMGEGSRAW